MPIVELIQGDARTVAIGGGSIVIIDPPWDMPELFAVGCRSPNRLVFCDGGRAFDAIAANGPPTWVFTWDCVTSWYVPNRPLRRQKLALWYGDISQYHQDGARHGDPCGRPRMVKNSRSEYLYVPNPDGKMLSDVYSYPITQLRKTQQFNHAKPMDWCRMLVANCRGECTTITDLFAGSGVFMGVAAQLGMDYVGVELDSDRFKNLESMRHNPAKPTIKPEQSSWL